jgi:hypothetical protein
MKWVVPLLGIIFSFFWLFSIGRTVSFQKIWKKRIEKVIDQLDENDQKEFLIFPTDEEKKEMPRYGKMRSTIILILPPVFVSVLWLIILICVLL